MSTVLEQFQGLEPAFSKPTLRLLRSDHARIYLAIFKTIFPDESQSVVAEDLWSRMDACLADLEQAGYADQLPIEDGQIKSGRAVCHDLIDRFGWVESSMAEVGQMEYRLTSDAIEALDLVERLGSTQTLMSGSRMRTLLDAIDMASVLFSPDYERGHDVLKHRLEDAQKQLDDYEATGGGEPLSPQQARDEIANIVNLMSGLPVDLRRLGEDIHAEADELIGTFREDERPLGEVIGGYLEQASRLLETTDQGRSFSDATQVLGNQGLSDQVTGRLEVIARSSLLEDSNFEQGRRLTFGWNQIAAGIGWVRDENTRASRAVNRAIAQHDITQDRELTATLKGLERAVYQWSEGRRRTDSAPFETTVGLSKARALMFLPWTPPVSTPPPDLVDEAPEVPTLSLEELRRLGGPETGELLDAMAKNLPLSAQSVSLTDAFNALDEELRRPVEVVGLMQLATTLGLDPERLALGDYECVSLDGRHVIWKGPALRISRQEFDSALEEAAHV